LVKPGQPGVARCERCGREAETERLWTIGIKVPPDARVEREICVICAAELRRYLLAEPGTATSDGSDVASDGDAAAEAARAWRVRSLLWHALGYVAIALGFLALVTWLTLE
jgi:hypothetical protein